MSAEFPRNKQYANVVIVSVPPVSYIPPPLWLAELLSNVQLITVELLLPYDIPPPQIAEFASNEQFIIVGLLLAFDIPPPE